MHHSPEMVRPLPEARTLVSQLAQYSTCCPHALTSSSDQEHRNSNIDHNGYQHNRLKPRGTGAVDRRLARQYSKGIVNSVKT